MRNRLGPCFAMLLLAAASLAQVGRVGGGKMGPPVPDDPGTAGVPRSGGRRGRAEQDAAPPIAKSQDEIVKSEHAQNVKDAQELAKLSGELRDSLEKNESYVLSLADLKRAEDIEKLAKKIHTRLRHG